MLNRRTPTIHANDSHPWGIVSPRRAQTTNFTINDGNFITDNRRETRVHHDNSQTINDSSNRTVFNGPVQGYVRTAKNRGAVNGYVQNTNVFHQVGGSGDASPREGLNENNASPTATADRTISHKNATQLRGGNLESNNEVGRSAVAVGSSAPNLKLEQELHNLSPEMQAFVEALQRDARQKEMLNAEHVKRRNHTM